MDAALARLEAAVDALAGAVAALPEKPPAAAPLVQGIPAEEVAALAERLSATLARLKAALGEVDAEAEEG